MDLEAGTATGQGSDTLSGFTAIIGSPFDDTLVGNGTHNTMIGLGGNDRFVGNGGDDHFVGGRGNDDFNGGSGWDSVTFEQSPTGVSVHLGYRTATGDGTDKVVSIEGVVGTMFDDVLIGTTVNNTFVPLGGDDRVVGGGAADDAVSFAASPKKVVVDLAAGTARGEGNDRLERIDNIVGSEKGDVLEGNNYGNIIWGMSGDDTIRGMGAADILIGGGGDDILDGGSGSDRCIDSQATRISCESTRSLDPVADDDDEVGTRWGLSRRIPGPVLRMMERNCSGMIGGSSVADRRLRIG